MPLDQKDKERWQREDKKIRGFNPRRFNNDYNERCLQRIEKNGEELPIKYSKKFSKN